MNYSSISRRFAAVFIDMLILVIPGCVLGSLIPVIGGLVVWFLYAPFLESSALKATIGKKLMGIQVVAVSGGAISFRASLVRALMKLISSCFFFLPHLLAFFTERHQALHDLVAETLVVNGREEIPVVDAWLAKVKEVFQFNDSFSLKFEGNKLGDLERLHSLFERGALSQEEFDREKAKILQG